MKDDLDDLVTDAEVMGLRAIYVAMPAGAVAFAAIIVALALMGGGPSQGDPVAGGSDPELLTLLSLVHGALLTGGLAVAALGPRALVATAARSAGDPTVVLARLRVATLVRIVVVEGAALFGLVVCLLAVTQGALADQPLYALNGLSTLVLVGVAVLTFPSRRRLVEAMREALRR